MTEQPTESADFPPRGGHDSLCAYAAGMSRRCTCEPTAEGIATAGTGAPMPQEA